MSIVRITNKKDSTKVDILEILRAFTGNNKPSTKVGITEFFEARFIKNKP